MMDVTIKYFSINSTEYVVRRYKLPLFFKELPDMSSLAIDIMNILRREKTIPRFNKSYRKFQNMSLENGLFMMSCYTDRVYIRKLKIHQI